MGERIKIKLGPKEYTPEQISAFILQKIKNDAEIFIGAPVKKAVITVPAYFNNAQRQSTKDAGEIAGLEVIRVLNEPTAAALAYGLDKSKEDSKLLVFDLGGGTLDVTIMTLSEGVFEVISTSGDTKLGGSDIDNLLCSEFDKEFKSKYGYSLFDSPETFMRLKEGVEKLKIELSTLLESKISLPFIGMSNGKPIHFEKKLNRAEFEKLITPLVDRMEKPINQALSDAQLDWSQIDSYLLIGGPTRIPFIRNTVERWSGKTADSSIDPMESVALGAATLGAMTLGDVKGMVLLDVLPLSIGVEVIGGVYSKILNRNSAIPTKGGQTYTTSFDNQESVEVKLYQGERAFVKNNFFLGSAILKGIPPLPAGRPAIRLDISVDEDGIITLDGKEQSSGKQLISLLKVQQKLSDEDLQKYLEEAEKHKESEKLKQESIQLKVELEKKIL